MTRTLLWDDGPGEARLGLLEDGELSEFRLIRPRRPEYALMAAGERYTARILSALSPGRSLATLGFGDDVIIQLARRLTEGSLIEVEMLRPPIPEPGRWKRAVVRSLDDGPATEPGWRFSYEPSERALRDYAPRVDEIICSNASSAVIVEGELGTSCPAVRIDADALDDADFDTLCDLAASGSFPIPDGELSMERTRAMTVIDVDGTADAISLNRAAARAIPAILRLYDIGGPIGIDFVSMKSRAERLEIDAILAEACQSLGPHERTAINGFGFAQIIRPRSRLSVPEILCETRPGILSTESRAVKLLRETGRSIGIGPRTLTAPPAIAAFITERSHELEALQYSLGAQVKLVSDASISGYGHVHVAPA